MAIFQYQTLSLTIDLAPSALSDYTEVVVSVQQGRNVTHFLYSEGKVTVDAVNGELTIELNQGDTSEFTPGFVCKLQVNILTSHGERLVSDWVDVDDVLANMYKRVMT